ncbi:hypothetical protein FDZ74_05475 [bacterium]|nr:MAG: hypothetical protein FDZ74_05475 [bacterium]
MKILSVSDVELGIIYSSQIAERFYDVDLVISCGDLPYYYLEYIISALNVPLYHVRGNHASKVEMTSMGDRTEPWGAINLHRQVKQDDTGLLLAGVEGSIQYNFGPHQYSQGSMWMMVFMMTPALFLNKLLYGRYLDVFVSHAPPWKLHDMDDLPHQGVKAFRWFDRVFQPQVHLHGHIHVYRQDTVTQTQFEKTLVMNTYGYREFYINVPRGRKRG